MYSSESDVFVAAFGAEVHSSGSEGSGEPAAKKRKRGARDNRRRGCKMTVPKEWHNSLKNFSSRGRKCGMLLVNVQWTTEKVFQQGGI